MVSVVVTSTCEREGVEIDIYRAKVEISIPSKQYVYCTFIAYQSRKTVIISVCSFCVFVLCTYYFTIHVYVCD